MSYTLPDIYCSEQQFRTQVRNALADISVRLAALENGTGIADNSIALSKLVQISNATLLGNRSGTTGNVTAVSDVGRWAP